MKGAIAFLKDPHFFSDIKADSVLLKDQGPDQKMYSLQLHRITALPPKFMKGVQSLELLEDYSNTYLKDKESQKEKLWQNTRRHIFEDENGKWQNGYMGGKSFVYHEFLLTALKTLKEEELTQIMQKTLLRAYRAPDSVSACKYLSDLYRQPRSKL